uniref:Uncharacterized protein n=1 Tax=Rhizophora mucronata TaxID=61149 RepID=A0A2P2J127_RHIMU
MLVRYWNSAAKVAWAIWRSRNLLVMEKKHIKVHPRPHMLTDMAMRLYSEQQHSGKEARGVTRNPPQFQHWQPPAAVLAPEEGSLSNLRRIILE